MPNPKAGTVTPNIVNTIKEIVKGKIEFKTDKAGIIHNILGKVSFGAKNIEENTKAFIDAVNAAKPSGVKGTYISSIFLATTMGPGIKLNKGAL
jgi:large subunit ribosomal protein L1